MKIFVASRAFCLAGVSLVPGVTTAAQLGVRTEAAVDYNLPAQDLGRTLRAIGQLSRHDILFPSDAVAGRTAPPVSGHLTLDEAVRAALGGTPLVAEHRAGAVLVHLPGSAPTEDSRKETENGNILVTGTRIRGAGSASPVIVSTRRALEQSGVTDLAAFTRILPQNYTGGQNPGITGGGEQGGQSNLNNSATLDLRGLGPDATLTLLNGHRLAYDALDQGIDLSAIPLSAIDRIEVVADGASALYGSDAVAGVANIILRPDYEGLEVTARVGGATEGGDFQQEYSVVAGHRWSTGGFMATLDQTSATPIFAGERDFTQTVDKSLTLTARNRQWSGVLTGHQQIAPGIRFDVDAFGMDRSVFKTNPFLPNADVSFSGLVTRPHVRSYGATPTLKMDVGTWRTSLSATGAISRTVLRASNYSRGVPRNSRLTYEDRLTGIEANAEGPLFALPGGDARLAVGGGLRRVSLHEHVVALLGGQDVTTINFTQRRDVQFAYGEVSLPLIGPDQSLPLINRLTLSGAVRYERWKGIDAVTTPKLGLVYEPVPTVTLRATWGQSFKVPTLFQVNQALQGALIPGIFFVPGPRPAGSTVLFLGGSSPGLKPEHATTWSGTLEMRPRIAPGLNLAATYFHVDYRGRIANPMTDATTALFNPLYNDLIVYNPSAATVNAVVATLPQGLLNETGAPFDPSNVGAILDDTIRNTARQRIHGVDLSADYHVDLGGSGRLLLTAAASHLDSAQQLAANQPFVQLAGTVFNPPHWRGRVGTVLEDKAGSLSAFVNYVGATADRRFAPVETVGSFTTLDLSGSLRTQNSVGALRQVELRFFALNILNAKPRPIRNSAVEAAPYDSTNQSPVGRFLGASIRKAW